MIVRRPRLAAVGVLAALFFAAAFAACAALESPIAPAPAAALYHCNALPFDLGFPFDPTLLDQPGAAEQGDDPRSVALRELLEQGGEASSLPAAGWHLIGTVGNRAEFVASTNAGFVSVRLEHSGSDWAVEGSGGCEPELVMGGGARAADWEVALDVPLDRTSTSITVLVHERGCASGEPPDDRIVGPTIVREPNVIRIAFGVIPLPGAQDCQGNPPARVVVELGEAFWDRVISDYGIWPPINEWAE